jgi:hypothetical protein
MSPRLKKWLIRTAAFLALAGLFVYATRSFWFRQFRIYALGLAEVRAEEFGMNLPEVDEIEVMALHQGRDERQPDGPDHVHGYSIAGRKTLRQSDASHVATRWRSLPTARVFSGLCHLPGYALRFRHKGKLIFETTVCWQCHNFTIPMVGSARTEYGFDKRSKASQDLLAVLQSHVPLPPEAERDARP